MCSNTQEQEEVDQIKSLVEPSSIDKSKSKVLGLATSLMLATQQIVDKITVLSSSLFHFF
jgi:hypothetical protein